MKTLGIIGGIAPPSTVDYYRRLTSGYRARDPEGSYPSLLVNSIDSIRFLSILWGGDRAKLVEHLLPELDVLARGGADLGLFASNSPHIVFDELAAESPIPLLSLVEETATAAESQGLTRVGLLGARVTMEAGFYPEVFARRGITVVVPEEDDRVYVNDRYFSELVEGSFRDETFAGTCAVIDRMPDIEAVVLGGTELPLLFRDRPAPGLPLLDTTAIHVESAIAWLLA